MLPAMATKPSIAIVGPGRLGSALAEHLGRAGYRITELISRQRTRPKQAIHSLAAKLGATVSNFDNATLYADLIWFCVPDREIAPVALSLVKNATWKGKTAFHSSGALPSSELQVLRRAGANIASVHPMMTFVRGTAPSLHGVPFALEGDQAAVKAAQGIVRNLGGEAFKIRATAKVAYHAWGAFTSPLLIALLVSAEQVARAAGLSATNARRKMMPILKQTIDNYARLGPGGAFSGPLIRGDVEVVRKHLQLLSKIPGARDIYSALARTAIRRLPISGRKSVEEILRRDNQDP
jgi:predicted short-subunit dehydrogenase-like oxidoreductase (DUF2520 family)